MKEYSGYLNIFKPKGITSHDVVFKTRKILGIKKIGHTGTLDPNAEGVLILCIGRATKMVSYLENLTKTYEAEIVFGAEYDTDDVTGKVIANKPVNFTKEMFVEALDAFRGEIMQVPPIFSALKVNGKRLYEYARAGESVEIAARPATIFDLEVIDFDQFPNAVKVRVHCSKGTYIRSLCRDIGRALNTAACMGDLLRTQVGNFDLADSITLESLKEIQQSDQVKSVLLEAETALNHLKKIVVSAQGSRFLINGNDLYQHNLSSTMEGLEDGEKVRLYNEESFHGIGQFHHNQNEAAFIHPVKRL